MHLVYRPFMIFTIVIIMINIRGQISSLGTTISTLVYCFLFLMHKVKIHCRFGINDFYMILKYHCNNTINSSSRSANEGSINKLSWYRFLRLSIQHKSSHLQPPEYARYYLENTINVISGTTSIFSDRKYDHPIV